jgi:hypothetical protein
VQLHRDRDEFEAAGVELAVIGQGTPEHAKHFEEQHDLDLKLLVDPDRKTYKAAGTKMATLGELLGPRVVAKGLRTAVSERVVQGRTVGHPAQLGGVLVVAPGGAVTWAHLADDAGDNPPNAEVLAAARAAASEA